MKIRNLINKENFIRYKHICITVICLLAALVVRIYDVNYCKQLDSQQLAHRWSDNNQFVQLSVFFEDQTGYSEGELYPIRNTLMQAATDVTADVDAQGRLVVDAYSFERELYLSSKQNATSVKAYGVSKDYFLFHPLKLLSGTYFTSSDEVDDGIILDELTAWKLFGAIDVAGLPVQINGNTYLVRGVVRNAEGHFSTASEETEPVIFVDFAMLAKELGEDNPLIDSYELLMANPVKNFAESKLQEAMGREDGYVLVDNTNRYSYSSRFKRLKNYGNRGMRTLKIVYPYWENRAIGYEDVVDLLTVLELLLLVYPLIFAVKNLILCINWLKKKKRLYKDQYMTSLLEKILVQLRQIRFVKKNTKE